MIKVAIVEDSLDEQNKIKEFFNSLNEYNYNLDFFFNGDQFLFDFKYGRYDLVLMDVDLSHKNNGIEVSKALREIDKDVILVFITNLAQYALDGYKVNAFDYIVKPFNDVDFSSRISIISKLIEDKKTKKILIQEDGVKVALLIKDIYYIEVSNHQTIYHTSKGIFKTYRPLKSIVEELEKFNFSLCNSFLLVNLEYVEKIEDFSCYVKGVKLSISHPKKKAFLNALNIFLGK